jgi:hypothetical protein
MENSFYYFFSAVPQVLGGILALFGVFIIFKLQTLNGEILIKGGEFVQYYIGHTKTPDPTSSAILEINAYKLRDAIKSGNLKLFKILLDNIRDDLIKESEKYIELNNLYKLGPNLQDATIIYSILTAAIIVICLSIIPFSQFFQNHTGLLKLAFGLTIFLIIICFVYLINILNTSLKNKPTFKKFIFF